MANQPEASGDGQQPAVTRAVGFIAAIAVLGVIGNCLGEITKSKCQKDCERRAEESKETSFLAKAANLSADETEKICRDVCKFTGED